MEVGSHAHKRFSGSSLLKHTTVPKSIFPVEAWLFDPQSILTMLTDIRAVASTHLFIREITHSIKTYLIPTQCQTQERES